MEIKGQKFMVTGGAGFIGSHLVDMLLEMGAAKVVVFDNVIRGGNYNLEAALADERTELFKVKGDLTHLDEIHAACEGVDGVFHLASLCLAHCQEFPRAGFDVNITGTFNLLDACIKNDISRVVFASSSSIYGNAVYSPMDEAHPWNNRNFYGASKIAGEALIRAFYYKYGLDYVNLRFMNAYGPRQDYLGAYVAVIIKVIDRIHQGLGPLVYGDGSQAFDFVYVYDICRSLVMAMDSSVTDESYNISSGVQTSVLEIANILRKIMNGDMPIEYVPVDDQTLVTNRIGSTEKAKNDLNFETIISLEEGLRKVVEWKLSKK
jgi:UDP-glucose 4-epimerase